MKRYAFLPGAFMTVAAAMWAALELEWGRPAIALGAGGMLALAVGVAANLKEIRDWFADPRGIFAVNSLMSTMLLVGILAVVNAGLRHRAPVFDWTEAGRNTLTEGTDTVLQQLQKDVVLTQFGRARDVVTDARLAAFAAKSRRLRVEFVDLDAVPQTVKKYGVTRPGTVVAESGDRFRKVERVTEPALTTAILQVTSSSEPLICFATGEGERGLADTGAQGLSGLAAVLTASNYRTDRTNLMQGGVPAACAVLVIAGLPGGLASEALTAVGDYVGRGGRLALMLDPPADPKIVEYLRPMGIEVGQGVVIETSSAGRAVGAGPENPLGLVYHEHPITRGFEQRTIYARALPLTVGTQETGLPMPLVSTGPAAFARADLLSTSAEFRQNRDRRGPFALAVATTLPPSSLDPTGRQPRIVVAGDSDFVTNTFQSVAPNRDLALRMIAWLAGEEESRIVSVAERQNRRIEMSEAGRTAMYVVNVVLLPLVPVVLGLLLLFRSRR